MSNPVLQLRMFDRDKDHAMFSAWCDAHGASATPAPLLPPLGVVVQMDGQDSAALFLYYSLSCPVAFIDGAATAPKLSVAQSVNALRFAYEYLNNEAATNGYTTIVAHVSPAFAKFMGNCGFNTQQEGMVRMFALTVDK